MPSRRRRVLYTLPTRVGPGIDVAPREVLITSHVHHARRRRRLRRSLRTAGHVLGAGLILGAGVIAGAAATHGVRTASVFAVARVEVVGTQRLTEAAILAAARVEPGTSLLAVDPDTIEDRVEALPAVRRARVVRHLPNRVVVAVEERQPYALVSVGGVGLIWIDTDGRLVAAERRPIPPPLPVLSGVEPPAAAADQPVGDRLRAGLVVLRAIQRTGGRLAGRISEIDLADAGGPVLYTLDGVEVRLGHESWSERLARFDGVLGELDDRRERAALVDLRYRDLVVIRPRRST